MPIAAPPVGTDLPSAARNDGVSLYARLAGSLRARIAQGEWNVGERLPAFDELSRTYGVAVNTVRKAVEQLCHEGVLQSGRGRGTVVAAPSAPAIDEPLRRAMYDPVSETGEVVIDVLRTESAPLPPGLVQDYVPAPPYVRILKTHSTRGMPYGVLDIYVVRSAYQRFPKGAIARRKVLNLLRDHGNANVRTTRQQLTVTHADDAVASVLRCPPASALVRIRRWKLDASRRIMLACEILYRGDMFVWDVTEPEKTARPIVPDERDRPR